MSLNVDCIIELNSTENTMNKINSSYFYHVLFVNFRPVLNIFVDSKDIICYFSI